MALKVSITEHDGDVGEIRAMINEEMDKQRLKRCSKCGKLLPMSEFYIDRSMKDGRMRNCKECDKIRRTASKNRERETKTLSEVIAEQTATVLKPTPLPLSAANRAILATISDDDLFAELRRRNYTGELTLAKRVAI